MAARLKANMTHAMPGRSRIARAYREACELELAALKPGNVHRAADGHGMTLTDFMRSAEVSAGPLTEPGLGLGERAFRAVAATREAVGCNTNLGIVLLCAPLVQAALDPGDSGLRERLRRTLRRADARDTDGLFRAIRLAAPAGLGVAELHDVAGPATAPPLEVMACADSKDLIARQYVTGYADLFERAVPLLVECEGRWGDPAWAAAAVYMDTLQRYPDSHVVRKLGPAVADEVRRRSAPIADALCRAGRPEAFRKTMSRLDREFKQAGINPGTCADLTVACLLIRRLEPLCSMSVQTATERRFRHPGSALPASGISIESP
ncbi:triphosphoribosyl-dephospho-CoA synthase [Thiocapsa rosea]|uniref:Triphosphoribosyl-dephospho-CoA synthase n=1 Tax=Thiocapsa rosea TaxID=69360 RepID=A0A495VCW5_9GAMM|nr:triphosphoribosyl-dephospho-CoA synthase [Thiocapsa rosea]RKT47114.1 triphosphoribosyl-dephospho-CoA synthase [Thiocapsa rosea]